MVKSFSDKQKLLILEKIVKETNKNYEIFTKRDENRDAENMLGNLNSI